MMPFPQTALLLEDLAEEAFLLEAFALEDFLLEDLTLDLVLDLALDLTLDLVLDFTLDFIDIVEALNALVGMGNKFEFPVFSSPSVGKRFETPVPGISVDSSVVGKKLKFFWFPGPVSDGGVVGPFVFVGATIEKGKKMEFQSMVEVEEGGVVLSGARNGKMVSRTVVSGGGGPVSMMSSKPALFTPTD